MGTGAALPSRMRRWGKGDAADARTSTTSDAAQNPGLRERAVAGGVEGLGDADLVALVLGTGHSRESVGAMAAALLDEHGGLRGLSRVGIGELTARVGMGLAKAARLVAALELSRRIALEATLAEAARFGDSRSVEAWARPRLATLEHEELWLLALDGHHHLRAARRVARGGLHGLSVTARDPLRLALREAASGFVLVHNHPSGDPRPSEEDIAFTARVARGAQAVGLCLVDHVIVAARGYTSLLDLGLLSATAGNGDGVSLPEPPSARSARPRRTTRDRKGRRTSPGSRAPA